MNMRLGVYYISEWYYCNHYPCGSSCSRMGKKECKL